MNFFVLITSVSRQGLSNPLLLAHTKSGADPGFLQREFVCLNVWGFALLISSHFS